MFKEKINPLQNYQDKITKFILDHEIDKKNINILEFGVREGRSTKMFLDICAKNEGKLISVDVDDYSNLFNDNNWTFLKTRDDDYEKVSSYFSKDFDIILIDSLHEPSHVSKLIYTYWKHLKLNGSMYIDDISWLPYMKNSWRDHEYTENINRDTFNKILEIQLSNYDNINLTFSFSGSGMCRIIKQNHNELSKPKLMFPRKNYIKKILKKLLFLFKKA
jgi:predicted O-methyltransferase YrrM